MNRIVIGEKYLLFLYKLIFPFFDTPQYRIKEDKCGQTSTCINLEFGSLMNIHSNKYNWKILCVMIHVL